MTQENDYLEYKNLFEKIREEFLTSVENAAFSQEKVLKEIIENNKNSIFGKKFGFDKIKSVEDYQKNVPLSTYEDYEPYIIRIMNGEKNILTKEDVILLEPTGGSTSFCTKLIPYTNSLKKAFQKGIDPWLSDLFLNFPKIVNNPMYWSITPKTKMPYVKTEIKIGFDDDMEYLSETFAKIVSKQLIYPENISSADFEEFQRQSANVIKNKDLAFVSVWNPSLFLILTEYAKINPEDMKNLEVISCWADGNSKIQAEKLRKKFKNTYIQEKGLLATEAIMTVPIEKIGKVPCVSSHFFEFSDIETGEIKLLFELEDNKSYSILLTTQGGLYRYKIGDIVRVEGRYKNCPLLSFEGRENNISDYFGEKLSEDFIKSILKEFSIKEISDFYFFAPKEEGEKFYYTLYLKTDKDTEELENKTEERLLENFHYKYARELNQIQKFKITKIQNDGEKQYLLNCTKKGQKLGDIKPSFFSNDKNWEFK